MIDLTALDKLAQATGTSTQQVATAVTAAITTAYQRTPGADPQRHVVLAAGVLRLDDGSDLPNGFDRAAAAAARAAMLEWVAAVRRTAGAGEWAGSEGRAVTGTVTGTTRKGETSVRLPGASGVVPAGEAVTGEELTRGRSVTFLVLAVNLDANERPRLTLSRRQPTLAWAIATDLNPDLPTPLTQLREPGTTTKVHLAPHDLETGRRALADPRVHERLGTGERVHAVSTVSGDLAASVAAVLPEGSIEQVRVLDAARREVELVLTPDQVHAVRGPGGIHLAHAKRLTGARISVRTP